VTSANDGPEKFDLVILGSGTGGKLSAWTLGMKGWRVAVVERHQVSLLVAADGERGVGRQ
jgi:flavin-dependent dehydrogenase